MSVMLQSIHRPNSLPLALLAGALCAGPSCIYVHAVDSDSGSTVEVRRQTMAVEEPAGASIQGRSGSKLSGTATFIEAPGGVEVRIVIENAPPGVHAVHIHESGDCSDPEGRSAGGHFNPEGVSHGAPSAIEHHAGDLGNMWVDENGVGHLWLLAHGLTIAAGPRSIIGRAIIIHAGADDLVSQPTGAAGGRIGCGVIR